MKLGVDTYSLRSQGWTAQQHLDYAHALALDVVHFSEPRFFDTLDSDYLRELKARADELGIEINVGMLSICPTAGAFDAQRGAAADQLRQMLHVARAVGSPFVRCVLGYGADRRSALPLQVHIEKTIETCRAARDLALDLGIKIAIENHAGDLQGRELRALIEAAGPEYVGACIDSGNAITAIESPFVTLDHLAPYVLTSHVRDTALWEHPLGAVALGVPMGDGTIHIDRWAQEFVARCPDASFTLEIVTGRPPIVLNYLEPAFWDAFLDTPAAEFAQFVRLAREGEAFLGPRLTVARDGDAPPEYAAALAVQERLDFERSVRYCQDVLGIGERRAARPH